MFAKPLSAESLTVADLTSFEKEDVEASFPLDLSADLFGFVLVCSRELACASILDRACSSATIGCDHWREDKAASKTVREKS